MRTRLPAVLAAVFLTLGVALPARASTGGTPDGDRHPDVGLIAFYESGVRYRCGATLVTPTVLLTAAHCTAGVDGVAVTFDTVIAEQPPSPLPEATDPAVGYTPADLTDSGYRYGTAHANPGFSGVRDLDDLDDVGVVVLAEPVTGIAPASPAPLGTLDAIERGDLPKTLFTAVGYGTEVRKPESGPQKPQPMSYPLIRRFVDMPGQKLTEQVLQTNGNPNDTRGTGGTCFGDSGGPVFLDGRIVAVTSYGLTENCRYLGGHQRVDIAAARDWLAGFGVF